MAQVATLPLVTRTRALGRHVQGVGSGHVVPVGPRGINEGSDRGAMEVPGAKAPDGYGGLSFSGGLFHQELTAQDSGHLGVEMLGTQPSAPAGISATRARPRRVSATISAPAEASMTTGLTRPRRRAGDEAPRRRRCCPALAQDRRPARRAGLGTPAASSPRLGSSPPQHRRACPKPDEPWMPRYRRRMGRSPRSPRLVTAAQPRVEKPSGGGHYALVYLQGSSERKSVAAGGTPTRPSKFVTAADQWRSSGNRGDLSSASPIADHLASSLPDHPPKLGWLALAASHSADAIPLG